MTTSHWQSTPASCTPRSRPASSLRPAPLRCPGRRASRAARWSGCSLSCCGRECAAVVVRRKAFKCLVHNLQPMSLACVAFAAGFWRRLLRKAFFAPTASCAFGW